MKKTVKLLALIWALFIIIVLLFFGAVHGMDVREINQNIYRAEIALNIAKKELEAKDSELYRKYTQHPYAMEGHMAEKQLRQKYPREYSRYIKAKIDLDDLQYQKYLMFVNAECDKG